jgi:hypothetical protein
MQAPLCSLDYSHVSRTGSTLKRGGIVNIWQRIRGGGAASNAIWAVALVIIVAMIIGVVYYSGILRGGAEKKVDINVSAPSR